MADLLESNTSVENVTCIKSEESERRFHCNGISGEHDWHVKLGVTASKASKSYFVTYCETVEELAPWITDPCTEIH